MLQQIIFTKYNFNKLVFLIANLILVAIFYSLINLEFNLFQKVILAGLISICLHYNLNILHQASHRLLSKNKGLNDLFGNLSAILGGVTFPGFQSTHFIHHKNPSDPTLDPDYAITNSKSFFFLPFKIWYHDRFYWQHGLWQKHFPAWQYFADRLAQISIVAAFYFTGHLQIWLYFWLLPIYFVGFLNGMFLFYFPHYSTKLENLWRTKISLLSQSKPYQNIIQKLSIFFIDISRYYHERHHDKIMENQNFYPLEKYLYDRLFLQTKPSIEYRAQYLDIYGSFETAN
jgi:fatty acid desaturase